MNNTLFITILSLLTLFSPVVKAQESMPATAIRQPDAFFRYAVYINEERPASDEGMMDAVKSVWLANERMGTYTKVCVTNPSAPIVWEKMKAVAPNALDVPITEILAADKALIAPGDVSKVIVEGCPDGRNIFTYVIDVEKHTAKQFPSTEGVMETNWEKKELTLSFYGYDDEGRYSYKQVFSIDGSFLRPTGAKER